MMLCMLHYSEKPEITLGILSLASCCYDFYLLDYNFMFHQVVICRHFMSLVMSKDFDFCKVFL